MDRREKMAGALKFLLAMTLLCFLLPGCGSPRAYSHPSRVLDDSSEHATVYFIVDGDSRKLAGRFGMYSMPVSLDESSLVTIPFGSYAVERIKPGSYRLLLGRMEREAWEYILFLWARPIMFTDVGVTFEEGKTYHYLLSLFLDTTSGLTGMMAKDIGWSEGRVLLDSHELVEPELEE